MIDASIDAGMIGKRSHLTRVALEMINRSMMHDQYPQSTQVNALRGDHD